VTACVNLCLMSRQRPFLVKKGKGGGFPLLPSPLLLSVGMFRSFVLWVMSPTRFPCATTLSLTGLEPQRVSCVCLDFAVPLGSLPIPSQLASGAATCGLVSTSFTEKPAPGRATSGPQRPNLRGSTTRSHVALNTQRPRRNVSFFLEKIFAPPASRRSPTSTKGVVERFFGPGLSTTMH
jgi:hypothetical protein